MNITRLWLLSLAGILTAHAEARLEFVDLRAQAGLAENRGVGGGLTLMCGNLGNKAVGDDGMPDDSGIVLGIRGGLNHVRAYNGDDWVNANVASIGALGGFGYYANKREHMELCVGYAIGRVTLPDANPGFSSNDGTSATWSGELGWYHTWRSHLQVGILGGWSWTRMTCNQDSPTEFTASSYGVNVAGSIGYRF